MKCIFTASLILSQIKLRGAILVIAFVVIVAIQAISLGYVVYFPSSTTTATYLLHLLFAIYLLVLAVQSVGKNTVYSHTRNIIHLSALTTLAFVLLGSAALLPLDRTSVSAPAEDSQPFLLKVAWYVVLGLYTLSTVVAITTPLGPALHFPISRIYSEKTVTAVTNHAVDNVSGVTGLYISRCWTLITNPHTGASVWDTLLFSYTTKVVLLGNTVESLDIGDLPIVPGSMRATYLFRSMRSALSTIRLRRLIFWNIRPGSGWELAYRLAYVNRIGFITQMALASLGAVLYYAPPFFLQKLVRYLETDPERHDRSWGWFFSFCMFASSASLHLSGTSSVFSVSCV